MRLFHFTKPTFTLLFVGIMSFFSVAAQQTNPAADRLHFGGSLGLSLGSGFTNILVAPSAIYDVNDYFSAGAGVQASYLSWRNNFESFNYGASLIGLVNPVQEVQLSAELEQLRVNNTYVVNNVKDNFWNTALFLGVGYRSNNVTVGMRYNVLFKENQNVYNEAFMPFVRVYF